MTTKKNASGLHDPYTDQLAAARYRAERDQAREEANRLRAEMEAMRPRLERVETWHRDKAELARLCDECGGIDGLLARLMPEGMEWLLDVWPKWSNGEYCKFGDWWKAGQYGEREPQQLRRLAFFTPEQLREWGQDEGENFGYEWDYMRPSDTAYRPDKVEPPAPKVLDADGVEIRKGDTVWTLKDTRELEVIGLYPEQDSCPVKVKEHKDGTYIFSGIEPTDLTHRAPVLAADGRPLLKGETVYDIEDKHGYPHTVVSTELDGLEHVKTTSEQPSPARNSIHPSRLTHERPDSWERLEEDANSLAEAETNGRGSYNAANDYCNAHGLEGGSVWVLMARDIVRRAKALAERDAK